MPWAGSEGSEAQPRKYNGKEWVEAFGYDNYLYGARDYYAAIGRFTVVDPFAEKYAHISPYAYCANNPIKYVDPDGREIFIGTWYGRLLAKLGVDNFEAKVVRQLESLKQLDVRLNNMISELEESSVIFYIKRINDKHNHYNPQINTIYYNPDSFIRKNGAKRPPEAALIHELRHAADDKNGTLIKFNTEITKGKKGSPQEQAQEQAKQLQNEIDAIDYENIVREKMDYPQRGYNYLSGE